MLVSRGGPQGTRVVGKTLGSEQDEIVPRQGERSEGHAGAGNEKKERMKG